MPKETTMKIIYEPKGKALEYAPLGLNLFRGCLNGCTYCYVPGIYRQSREEFHSECYAVKDWKERLEKDLLFLKKEGRQDQEVLLSFATDPFQRDPKLAKITHEALKMFRLHGQRFTTLTKTPTNMLPTTISLYSPDDAFGITLTQIVNWHMEPNTDNWKKRILMLEVAKASKIRTWISFEPAINYNDIMFFYEQTKDYCDLYRIGAASKPMSDIDLYALTNDFIERCTKDKKEFYVKNSLRRYVK